MPALKHWPFLRGVRDEEAETEVLRAGTVLDWGVCGPTHVSKNTQLPGLRFRAFLAEGGNRRLQLNRS
ncbi:MAG TPA: hypothetical protein VFY59_14440 [Rubrobacter sp.]|nr:hypothetical protein [Rubrobacter sp.]